MQFSKKVFLREFSSVIDVINDNGTHFSAVFKVGGGDHDTVLGKQLRCLHIGDLAAHQHLKGGVDQQLVPPDIQPARASDDLVHVIDALGHVFHVMTADALRHIIAVALAFGVFAFRQLF